VEGCLGRAEGSAEEEEEEEGNESNVPKSPKSSNEDISPCRGVPKSSELKSSFGGGGAFEGPDE
jgi:hypothetical protein